MSNNFYPDFTKVGSDINYHQLKVLASDVKSRLFNQGDASDGNVGQPQTGDGGGDDNPVPPGGSGCKRVYVANMTQTGTANPVPTIFENTIGPIVWTRIDVGIYQGILATKFPIHNTWLVINKDSVLIGGDQREFSFKWIDENTVELRSNDLSVIAPADGMLNDLSIEIRTYCTEIDPADCLPIDPVEFSLPDAGVGIPYLFELTLTGTPPYTRTIIEKPDWMEIEIVGDNVRFSGTPDEAGESVVVSFTVNNCADDEIEVGTFITVVELGEFTIRHDVITTGHSEITVLPASGGASGYVDWGDGVLEAFSIPALSPLTFVHEYATPGEYSQVFYFDANSNIFLFNNIFEGSAQKTTHFTHSDNFTNFTGSVSLMGVMDIGNVLPPAASNITTLELSGHADSTQTTSDLSSLVASVASLSITSFPALETITGLPATITNSYVIVDNPNLDSINAGGNMPPASQQQQLGENKDGLVFGTLDLSTCTSFVFNQDFSVSQVNAFLTGLDANTLTDGNVSIKQTPAATPTGAGATSKANLISKSWFANTD